MEQEIHVAFPICTTKTEEKEKRDGEKSMKELAEMILAQAAAHAAEGTPQFLHELRRVAGSVRLVDRSKRVITPERCFYKPYYMDELMFLAAQVENIEIYGYKDCYAKVAYADNGKIYHGTVIFPAAAYYRFLDGGELTEKKPIYLIGTCIRKEYKKNAKKTYNKYMMKMVTVSDAKTVKRTKMLQFHICNIPDGQTANL